MKIFYFFLILFLGFLRKLFSFITSLIFKLSELFDNFSHLMSDLFDLLTGLSIKSPFNFVKLFVSLTFLLSSMMDFSFSFPHFLFALLIFDTDRSLTFLTLLILNLFNILFQLLLLKRFFGFLLNLLLWHLNRILFDLLSLGLFLF